MKLVPIGNTEAIDGYYIMNDVTVGRFIYIRSAFL